MEFLERVWRGIRFQSGQRRCWSMPCIGRIRRARRQERLGFEMGRSVRVRSKMGRDVRIRFKMGWGEMGRTARIGSEICRQVRLLSETGGTGRVAGQRVVDMARRVLP